MAHEPATALRLAGVDAFYGDSHVLHGVSFSLVRGRVLALLGRNGAGKTTCMNAVMGMLRTCSGEIRLFDEAILGLAPDAIARRGVGLVPQGRRIFQSLTVFENLSVALVSNPRVLLMDEPSEGLAPRIVHELGQTLVSLKAVGFSIVLVEQNATLALGVADDVAIINTGRIVYEGSAGEARAQPDLLNSHLGIL